MCVRIVCVVCVCVCVCVRVCVCVCVCVCIMRQQESSAWSIGLVTARSQVQCPVVPVAVVVVSLSKKLYSHCSSLPSSINGDLKSYRSVITDLRTFLLHRINIPTMEKISASIPEYQPLRILWHSLCDNAQ